ncbi:hypothetical protein [Pararhodospirillum oryzae]|uniref:PIN domain-containing protein n=1 Tax=Pararhodospirillum oryzae TaxID=478448 RepID=A0A512H8A1_9PROT|nr:hypothetical protein [Pararhodospirillum oryzae]GEO81684.1 hypothetical protein ROR02_18150 [Pararhodospirillum oryzae]
MPAAIAPCTILMDTCIFLNVLEVPGRSQDRDAVWRELDRLVEDPDTHHLLLPMAAIIETGNFIAQVSDGRQRRETALRFTKQVKAAIEGSAPWQAMEPPDTATIRSWLAEFPDHAMRGVGMGDLSILKEWERCCARLPRHHRVRIWSLDHALQGYDRSPRP